MFKMRLSAGRVAAVAVLILFVAGISFVSIFPGKAQALLMPFGPFGGMIYNLTRCVNGVLVELGPPSFDSYMWLADSSFSYSYGPPVVEGQWLLGMAFDEAYCLVPCHAGLCPIGSGWAIIYHGSSMPLGAIL